MSVPLLLHRIARALHRSRVPLLPRALYLINRLVFGCVVPPTASIGRNVLLGYAGLGVVIHRRAIIGDNVVLSPGVVIGGRGAHYAVPVIDDDVLIGANACVLGPVRIGRGARIGAGAVVLTDVPAGATAVGNPARIVPVRADGPPRQSDDPRANSVSPA